MTRFTTKDEKFIVGSKEIKPQMTICGNEIVGLGSFKFQVNTDKENRIKLLEEIKKFIPDDLNPEQTEMLKKQIIEAFRLEGVIKHTDL